MRPQVHADVAAALTGGGPVVALESTIIAHGLPRPRNLEVAREIEQVVRDEGAVPATIGVVAGRPVIGLDEEQIERLATTPDVLKLSGRDLPLAAATGADGATTVASTSLLAAAVGIDLFATGGLGGVHRDARSSWDESADLVTLARVPITVVCSGVKSILDVPATLERLETLGVSVVGFGTSRFPGFYLRDSGYDLDWCVDSPDAVARAIAARGALGLPPHGLVVANPLPEDEQLDPAVHDRVLDEALGLVAEQHIAGKDVTPFLLAHFHEATEGESLEVNIRLVLRNARLAAQIAVASCR